MKKIKQEIRLIESLTPLGDLGAIKNYHFKVEASFPCSRLILASFSNHVMTC